MSTSTFQSTFTVQGSPNRQPGVIVNGRHYSVLGSPTQPDGTAATYTILKPYQPLITEDTDLGTLAPILTDSDLPPSLNGTPRAVDEICFDLPNECFTNLPADHSWVVSGRITFSNKHFQIRIPTWAIYSPTDGKSRWAVTQANVRAPSASAIPFSKYFENDFKLHYVPDRDVASNGALGNLLSPQTKSYVDAYAAWLSGKPGQQYELGSVNTEASGHATGYALGGWNFKLVAPPSQ